MMRFQNWPGNYLKDLQAGDVIVRKKSPIGVIDHFGLYVGNGQVIDSHPNRGVSEIRLGDFLDGRPLIRVNRFVGNFYQRKQVVSRARSLVGIAYDVTSFNCEHLVNEAWGVGRKSEQVNSFVGAVLLVIFAVTIGNLMRD